MREIVFALILATGLVLAAFIYSGGFYQTNEVVIQGHPVITTTNRITGTSTTYAVMHDPVHGFAMLKRIPYAKEVKNGTH